MLEKEAPLTTIDILNFEMLSVQASMFFQRAVDSTKKKQVMPYKEASMLFDAYYHACIIKKGKKPIDWGSMSDDMKSALTNIVLWAIDSPNSLYPLCKGLNLLGDLGTGKTTIIEALSLFLKAIDSYKQFEIVNVNSMFFDISKNGDIQKYVEMGNVCWNDVGVRSPEIEYYKKIIRPVDDIFQIRYDTTPRPLNIMTTNIGKEDLLSFYQPRTLDRLPEMFTNVKLTGKSLR